MIDSDVFFSKYLSPSQKPKGQQVSDARLLTFNSTQIKLSPHESKALSERPAFIISTRRALSFDNIPCNNVQYLTAQVRALLKSSHEIADEMQSMGMKGAQQLALHRFQLDSENMYHFLRTISHLEKLESDNTNAITVLKERIEEMRQRQEEMKIENAELYSQQQDAVENNKDKKNIINQMTTSIQEKDQQIEELKIKNSQVDWDLYYVILDILSKNNNLSQILFQYGVKSQINESEQHFQSESEQKRYYKQNQQSDQDQSIRILLEFQQVLDRYINSNYEEVIEEQIIKMEQDQEEKQQISESLSQSLKQNQINYQQINDLTQKVDDLTQIKSKLMERVEQLTQQKQKLALHQAIEMQNLKEELEAVQGQCSDVTRNYDTLYSECVAKQQEFKVCLKQADISKKQLEQEKIIAVNENQVMMTECQGLKQQIECFQILNSEEQAQLQNQNNQLQKSLHQYLEQLKNTSDNAQLLHKENIQLDGVITQQKENLLTVSQQLQEYRIASQNEITFLTTQLAQQKREILDKSTAQNDLSSLQIQYQRVCFQLNQSEEKITSLREKALECNDQNTLLQSQMKTIKDSQKEKDSVYHDVQIKYSVNQMKIETFRKLTIKMLKNYDKSLNPNEESLENLIKMALNYSKKSQDNKENSIFNDSY